MKPLLSVQDLARKLRTPIERLREIADNIGAHYRSWQQWERKDKFRVITEPDCELKAIQRRLNKYVFASLELSDAAHGGVSGRSPLSNAQMHLGKPCVVTLDAREFFDSIRHYTVYRMLRHELGFGRDVARLITRLTTLDSRLPQGCPTSTTIANFVLALPVDAPLAAAAAEMGVTCTRFVDDIALSGANPRPLINEVARLLSRRRLQMHRKKAKYHPKPKLRIMSRSRPQKVTGLLVNSGGRPSVPRERRDAVRAAIFELDRIESPSARRDAQASIRGRIGHIRQLHPGAAARLEKYLVARLERRARPG